MIPNQLAEKVIAGVRLGRLAGGSYEPQQEEALQIVRRVIENGGELVLGELLAQVRAEDCVNQRAC